MLTDFRNSFTFQLSSDFVTHWSLRTHLALNASLHYLVKLEYSKIDLINTLI